jgi:hypothetical protein
MLLASRHESCRSANFTNSVLRSPGLGGPSLADNWKAFCFDVNGAIEINSFHHAFTNPNASALGRGFSHCGSIGAYHATCKNYRLWYVGMDF